MALALDDAASRDMVVGFKRDAHGQLQLATWNASEEEKDFSRRIDAEIKAVFPTYEPRPRMHASATMWEPCFLGPDYDPNKCPCLYKMYFDALFEVETERRLQESVSSTDKIE